MRQFGVEVGATRQRESGLTLPRSAGSDARCRAGLAQPSSQLPRDDLTPTTRQSMLLADPARIPRRTILMLASGVSPQPMDRPRLTYTPVPALQPLRRRLVAARMPRLAQGRGA